jgi:amino acid adenylation domain-containing protein
MSETSRPALANAIAVTGMSGRFPQAPTLARFWRNLRDGLEAITFFSDEAVAASGVDASLLGRPDYVKARGALAEIDLFDTGFFGFSARDAALLDPQQRLFLECGWEALEDAGCDPETFAGRIGVFAGASANSYYLFHLFSRRDLLSAVGGVQALIGHEKDFLASRLSYKLNLRGPSLSIQTACSTSLVAVHVACQSLLNGECDLALAGGVSVQVPQEIGHLYQPGGIASPDGHCRAFDAAAGGSVGGSGVGVVVLRRLEDALAAGDAVRALIRGSAVNNDGAQKVGFTAPSLEGQAEVIAEALAVAGLEPRDVSYVEAHGSGTLLGDPIEIAALTLAFGGDGDAGEDRRRCAVGSVKTNIGHLDAAAGVAGLIKTVLALEHRTLVPSLHFTRPNPKIDFAGGPFYVNTETVEWPAEGGPRRAGVSSFGIGGTNAHVVLEEAPPVAAAGSPGRPWQLLLLSARTAGALEAASDRLAAHLAAHPDLSLADLAATLQGGRRRFEHRRMLVCRQLEEAERALAGRDPGQLVTTWQEAVDRPVVFLFSGLGEQRTQMGRALYLGEETFRQRVDRCAELLAPEIGLDLRAVLYPAAPAPAVTGQRRLLEFRSSGEETAGDEQDELARTALAQPAAFVFGYALAGLWGQWGIRPRAVVGYSVGEYLAACLAGVLSLEDALLLVARRARWIDELPAGGMLAVPLGESELDRRLGAELVVAACNGPQLSVVAGPAAAVSRLEHELRGEGVPCRRLRTRHAFHSPMMAPLAERFNRQLAEVTLRPPQMPWVSTVTGGWVTAAEVTAPAYWVRHLCEPIRFRQAMATVWQDPECVVLEVGPGAALSSLALQLAPAGGERLALASQPPSAAPEDDASFLLGTLGKLWLAGARVDWEGFRGGERRCRLRLPTYPFERRRHWVEPARGEPAADREAADREERPQATTTYGRPNLPHPYVAPGNAVEEALAGIWQELLGLTQVGVRDDFFALGGHSLLATQLAARVREIHGVELPVEKLFSAPTVAELALVVEELRQAAGALAAAAGPAAGGERQRIGRRQAPGWAPASFAQQRFWFVDQLDPGLIAYNNPVAVRLDGRLDEQCLARSLDEVARRHEILRTRFAVGPDGLLQIVMPWCAAALPRVDLDGLATARREAEARRLAVVVTRRPFDLGRGPLLRSALLRLGHDRHLFVVVLHHVVADEWSLRIFLQEVAALYSAFAAGAPSPLAPLPIQFGDFAHWQRETLTGETLAGHLEFWRERLRGAPPVLALPTDRPRPARQSFRGAFLPFALEAEATQALGALCRAEGLTLFMALMAGFQILLHRYSGQDDLVTSTGIGNRSRAETEPLIGCFINLLLLRADFTANPTLRQLLRDTRRATLDAYAHQDLPFEALVEHLRPDRDASYSALAQVMLVLLNVPPLAIEAGTLRMEGVAVERGTAQFDLTLYLTEQAGSLSGFAEYSTDLFDSATVARLLGHFALLLARCGADLDRPVAALPMLGEAERRQALVDWNETAMPLPCDDCLHQLFAAQAARQPEAPAILFAGLALGFGELDRRADRLARHLGGLGVRRGELVGVGLGRSPRVAVALLGILKAGAAYVPLDPAYPEQRLAGMLAQTATRVLVTEESLAARFAGFGVQTVVLEAADPPGELPAAAAAAGAGGAGGASGAGGAVGPADLVYAIFTSGSTGQPKAVLLDHRGRVNNFTDLSRRFAIGPGDRILALSSLSFDMSAYDILGVLAAGATVVLPRPEEAREPAAWAELIARHQVTLWHSVPAMMEMLLDHLAAHPLQTLQSLRLVLLGGDWIPVTLPDRVRRLGNGLEVVSLGGATEASMDSVVYRIGLVAPGWKSIPYGRPLANQRAYVLDPELEPVPVGVVGELHLGGAGVAWGYLGQAGLTAARFVPDALGAAPGGRLYKTGDLARYLADGTLALVGRLDHQVKIRGFRVEIGEIETALRRLPGVREAVVVARPDRRGERSLVAYLVPASGGAPAAPEVKERLRQSLPSYMVPAAVVALAALPLTPNGKLDRAALPPPAERAGHDEDFVAPKGPLESLLAGIWLDVLGVERVSAHDDFFDLGGHSLLATRVVTRLAEVLPLEVPLRTLFEAPTLTQLAGRLAALAGPSRGEIERIAEILLEVDEAADDGFQESPRLPEDPDATGAQSV